VEGISGPGIVPVDRAAVDDRWELAAPVPELLSHWGEGKHNMEILPAELHEIGLNVIS